MYIPKRHNHNSYIRNKADEVYHSRFYSPSLLVPSLPHIFVALYRLFPVIAPITESQTNINVSPILGLPSLSSLSSLSLSLEW